MLMTAVAAPAPVAAADKPATALRVALDGILGEHAFLIIEAMRTGLTAGPEYDAAANALDANTDALVGAITGIYGQAAGDAFGEQWRNHIAFIVDYARALSTNNTSAAQLADSQLKDYVTKFSTLLAGAVELPEAAVEGLIREHVEQLEQVASFEQSRFGEAYPAILETYQHMFMIGDALATAIIAQKADKFPGRDFAFSAATDLRLSLDQLLGGHTELAALAMRAGLTLSPDVEASVNALNQNTEDLRAAITSIYGPAAGQAFLAQWTEHTSAYLAYVSAKRSGDTSGQQAALDRLRNYQTTFTNLLVKANPHLSATHFRELIAAHTDHLINSADQYAAMDFAAAYTTEREGFAHSGVLSAYLASAIATQFPGRFPNAAVADEIPMLTILGIALLVMAGLVVVGRGVRRFAAPRREPGSRRPA
jgi:hypothetical protein